ncbi:MAG: GntR family transcriptional regulator [Brevinema sp.]
MSNNLTLKKYQIIVSDIKRDIFDGKYEKDALIPSETNLMKIYGISRITARKSLDTLESMGLIYKIQGKGCFVSGRQKNQSLLSIHSYTDGIINIGMKPHRKILQAIIRTATSDEASQLRIAPNSDIFVLERVIYADQSFLCLVTSILPYGLFPKIMDFDFARFSLYEVLESEYGIIVTRTALNIDAVCIDKEIADKISLSIYTPLLLLTITAYSNITGKKDIPLELSTSYYNPKTISYSIDKTLG